MGTQPKQLAAKRGQTDQIIDQWLQERQELLVLLYRLLKIKPFDNEALASEQEVLQEFCEILVDYVSAGHFEVFEKIAEANENSQSDQLGLDRELLVKILQTTVPAMDFSNQYAQPNNIQLDTLEKDLSRLGEQLASRMDLEDKLIQSYHLATAHLDKIHKGRKANTN